MSAISCLTRMKTLPHNQEGTLYLATNGIFCVLDSPFLIRPFVFFGLAVL